jgi:hypothetical protein
MPENVSVIRDGKPSTVDAKDLVVGDVVNLKVSCVVFVWCVFVVLCLCGVCVLCLCFVFCVCVCVGVQSRLVSSRLVSCGQLLVFSFGLCRVSYLLISSLVLKAGDKIPADIRIVSCSDDMKVGGRTLTVTLTLTLTLTFTFTITFTFTFTLTLPLPLPLP